MALAFKAGASVRQVARAFGVPTAEVHRAIRKNLWPGGFRARTTDER